MKLSTRRDTLFSQLQTVTRAASTRSAVQALSGVLVQARGGTVELRATDMEIGFNPEFLRDGLEAVEGGDVVLKLISPLRPGLIQAADGSGFVYLLMPIRLNV